MNRLYKRGLSILLSMTLLITLVIVPAGASTRQKSATATITLSSTSDYNSFTLTVSSSYTTSGGRYYPLDPQYVTIADYNSIQSNPQYNGYGTSGSLYFDTGYNNWYIWDTGGALQSLPRYNSGTGYDSLYKISGQGYVNYYYVQGVNGFANITLSLTETYTGYSVYFTPTGQIPPGMSSSSVSSNIKAGTSVPVDPNPTAAGYTFSGWTTSSVTVSGGSFIMPASNVWFTGTWSARNDTPYTVEFYTQDALGSSTYSFCSADTLHRQGTTGTKINAALDMNALGSKYTHFHLTDTSKADNTTIGGTGTSVLKLYYDYDAANVTYAYSGTVPKKAPPIPNSTKHVIGTTVSVATAPVLAGYDFSGWSTTGAFISNGIFTMPTSNITLTGNWIPRTDTPYTVEYYQQNIGDDNYTQVTADTYHGLGTTDTMLVVPEKAYPGFTIKPESVTASSSTNIEGDGTTVLKLYYDRNSYSLTYQYAGQTDTTPPALPSVTQHRYGAMVYVPAAPTLTGYDFSGWETTDTTINQGAFMMPAQDATITGTWTPRSDTPFVVEYYQQNLADPDYTKVAADTYAGVGTTGTTIPQAHKEYEGFTETGPSVAAETATKIASNGNTVLKLYYDRNSYAVTYAYTSEHIDGEPACPAEQHFQYGAPVTVEPALSELTGYHFGGWTSNDVSLSSGIFTMPAKDVAISGAWLPNTDTPYTVEFYQQNVDNDEYSIADTVNGHGTTMGAILEAGKTYPGFIMTTASTAEAGAIVIAPDGSTVLKLYYDRKHHSVTYTYAGDVPTTPQPLPAKADYRFGQSVLLSAAPEAVSGKCFMGWDSADVATTAGTFQMPDKDVTITGTWQLSGGDVVNTITLIAENSTKIISFTPGNQIILPTGPVKDNYTFIGWADTDGGAVNHKAGDAITLTKAITLFAVYAKQVGQFIYGYRDGTFRPEDNLTTYQTQLMLARLMDTPAPDVSTNTKKAISRKDFLAVVEQSTATALVNDDVVSTAAKKGWIQGCADGSIHEDAYITRAQAVVILNRAFNCSSVQPDNAVGYTDLPKGYWAYNQIIAASTAPTTYGKK